MAANQLGIVPITVQANGIASFSVAAVSAEDAGFAIDNVAFPGPFTITGHNALPKPPSPPDPTSEFAGAEFLRDFLAGNTAAVPMGDGSALAADVKKSGTFARFDKMVQQQAKQLLDAGQRMVKLSVKSNPVFSAPDTQDPAAARDLAYAFGGTQGLDISGHGYLKNGKYTGTITYVIRDIYGFYAKDKFHGVGPQMHYLQGVCGSPWFRYGAHWFPDSVTVTIPFSQPAG